MNAAIRFHFSARGVWLFVPVADPQGSDPLFAAVRLVRDGHGQSRP